MDWDVMATVGRVIRPHGHRGHVVVAPTTDFPADRFAPGARVHAKSGGERQLRTLVVEASREQHGRWVVGFEGVGSIEEADVLRGLELRIPAEDLRPLPAGRYYLHDLAGCEVRTASGARVGTVVRVDEIGGIAMLVVIDTPASAEDDGRSDRDEMLVPFSEAICRRVDIGARLIEIEAPEGLLDLNRRSGPT